MIKGDQRENKIHSKDMEGLSVAITLFWCRKQMDEKAWVIFISLLFI